MTKCPECGVDLKGLDPRAHAISHWGETVPDPSKYPDAAKRYAEVLRAGGEK